MSDRPVKGVHCKREAPPDTPRSQLPFFEARGPGTQDDRCANCRYYECAHDGHLTSGEYREKWGREKPLGLGRPLECAGGFAPMVDGYEYDLFYCGCRGWD